MGNLADELGDDAFNDEGVYDDSSIFLDGLREGQDISGLEQQAEDESGHRQNTLEALTANGHDRETIKSGTPSPSRSRRQTDHETNGSYTHEESDDLPRSLSRAIDGVALLVREFTTTDEAVSEGGGTIQRMLHYLQDLGPQSSIEASTTRLVTAYNAMTSHRMRAMKDVVRETQALLYRSSHLYELPPELIESIIEQIHQLQASISPAETLPYSNGDINANISTSPRKSSSTAPSTSPNPVLSLHHLTTDTTLLTTHLRALTDTLTETHHLTTLASRRLRTTRDIVETMNNENELAELAIQHINAWGWDGRLAGREAGRQVREVLDGFEAVCEGWRGRMVEAMEMEVEGAEEGLVTG